MTVLYSLKSSAAWIEAEGLAGKRLGDTLAKNIIMAHLWENWVYDRERIRRMLQQTMSAFTAAMFASHHKLQTRVKQYARAIHELPRLLFELVDSGLLVTHTV